MRQEEREEGDVVAEDKNHERVNTTWRKKKEANEEEDYTRLQRITQSNTGFCEVV